VPVKTSTGALLYRDITIPFLVAPGGAVTLNTAGLKIEPSPKVLVGKFLPGTYDGVKGYDFTIGTPGIGPDGRVTTSIQGDGSRVFNANWVSGPIAGHPYEALLTAARVPAGQTWGIMGDTSAYYYGSTWAQGTIISAVQTGNQLTLTNYGTSNLPRSTLVFNLCPTSDPC